MAAMIGENGYLIPEEDRRNYAEKNRLLVTVKDL
jgi:hypothetical protein